MMPVSPFDQFQERDLIVFQQRPVIPHDSLRDQMEHPAVRTDCVIEVISLEQFPQTYNPILHFRYIAHGQSHINVTHGIHHGCDGIIPLPALLPEIYDHVCLAIGQESPVCRYQLRDPEARRIVVDLPDQFVG